MQVDLYDNLTIDTVLYHGNSLSFTRDGNAVHIDLPAETATGIDAGAFWPCKDHLSDRPDSMRITVPVPQGLSDISDGRLGQTRPCAT